MNTTHGTVLELEGTDAVSSATRTGEGGSPGFGPGSTLEMTSAAPCDLARCSVEDLSATFARARLAIALAKLGAAHAVKSTRTIAFISLIGR